MAKKLTINSIKKNQWMGHWSGKWALLNDSLLGYQYTRLLKKDLGCGFEKAVFISGKGFTSCYLAEEDYHKFGIYLSSKAENDKKIAIKWCSDLKKATDEILNLIKELKQKEIDYSDYKKFIKFFYGYGVPHRAVKIVVDFLPNELLKELLPKLQKARLYSEPVYSETEKFMRFMAKQISKKTGYDQKIILYTDRLEMDEYFRNGNLPNKSILKKRYAKSALLCVNGEGDLFTEKQVDNIDKIITNASGDNGIINGNSAYPGKAKGVVRVVTDPKKAGVFNKGDILVTGMTRPEFLHLVKKSAAFITDAGGMLSHAAISARELKKPCVVGTLVATKVFKNGDKIEVDAKKGIIKKLK